MYVQILQLILVCAVFEASPTPSFDLRSPEKAIRSKKDVTALILTPIDDETPPDHKFRKCTSTGCDHENNKHVFRFCGSVPCPGGGDSHDKNVNAKTRATDAVIRSTKLWGPWGRWSACSASCGLGKMTRWRHCISGNCAYGEKEAQIKTCMYREC